MSEEPELNPQVDLFYDPADTQLDLSSGPKHLADLASIANEPPQAPGPVPEFPTELVDAEPEPPKEPEPEVVKFDDGTTAEIKKTSRGWSATLDNKVSQPEVFYGHTQAEMYQNIMRAKIEATKKIRDQNRTIKLGNSHAQPAAEAPTAPRTRSPFSADEISQLKLQLADNPDLALDTWFQKKTGRTVEELESMAEDGRRARQITEADNTSRAFMASTPEYHASPANYQAMLGWISRYKLNKILNEGNWQPIMFEVYDKNLWTVEVITEAYEDLRENGLLEVPVQEEEIEEPTPPPAPVPVAISTGPVQTRPRKLAAGLGIRVNEARSSKVTAPADDAPTSLESLSDEEIEKLMTGVRKLPEAMKKDYIEKTRQRQA